MIGLPRIPGERDLMKAYDAFLSPAPKLSSQRLALYAQWVRFDPRLGEILVGYIQKHWQAHSPLRLRDAIQAQPWPQALGVLLEQALLFFVGDKTEKRLFRAWKTLVLCDLPPRPSAEIFFIGTQAFAGKSALRIAMQPNKTFRKWGFLGDEFFINAAHDKSQAKQTRAVTAIDKKQRFAKLAELVKIKKRIRISDYRDYLNHAVSQRQAQLDLTEFLKQRPHSKVFGNTRNRIYVFSRSKG